MPARTKVTSRKSAKRIELPEERTFVNPSAVSPHLSCPICQEVFENPQRAPCGHTFCKKCIDPWIATNPVCPVDRRPVLAGHMHHDFLIESIIGDYTVACPWRSLGCDYIGPLHLLPSHKKSCFVNPELLPEALRPRTTALLKRNNSETAHLAALKQLRMSRSLPRSLPVTSNTTVQSPETAHLVNSNSENNLNGGGSENCSHSPSPSTSQPGISTDTLNDSAVGNTDDEEEHLPPAPQPSLLFRLYHDLDTASRDLLCNFLGNSTVPSPSPAAKRRRRR